jgi:glycosyltransferase involved in cell wall biosynthesis
MAAADVFCQPNSRPESFGIAMVEALYAGVPVVATNLGGALEVVHSTCGILVEPSPQALARALLELAFDPTRRRKLGNAGPARARELCLPIRKVEELTRALAGVLQNRS